MQYLDFNMRYPTLEELNYRVQQSKELLEKHPEFKEMLTRKITEAEHEIKVYINKKFVREVMELARKYSVDCHIQSGEIKADLYL